MSGENAISPPGGAYPRLLSNAYFVIIASSVRNKVSISFNLQEHKNYGQHLHHPP